MDLKKTFFFLIIILVSFQIFAIETESFNVQKKIILATEAEEPQIIENYIIFTFKSSEKTSFVGASFDFDNFVKIYQFKKNPEGIYVLVMNKPEKESIKYRLVVDGLWMADPSNPVKITKPNSVEISVFNIADKLSKEKSYPSTENGITCFRYKGEEGKNVYLAGNFNKWDPFMYHMAEKRAGEYFVSLKLPPGTYYYYFAVNGKILPDKDNPNVVWDNDFREISAHTVK